MEYFFKIEYCIPIVLVLIMIVLMSQQNGEILAYSHSFSVLRVLAQPVRDMYKTIPNMLSTSYTSDGRSLNATIWLSHPLYGNQSYYGRADGKLTYGIRIFLYNYTRPFYNVYIQQQRNGTWTKNAVEYDPLSNVFKPLEVERKYTGLSNQGSKFINLSLDLDTIGFPDKYRVDSYANITSFPFILLAKTYPVNLPPTTTELCGLSCVVPSWPSIQVFSGQTLNISIPIKSTDYITTRSVDGERYRVHLQENGSNSYGIRLSLSPKIIELPIAGSNRTFLQITTPSDIASKNYTLSLIEHFTHLRHGRSVFSTRILTSLNIEVLKQLNLYQQILQVASQFLNSNMTVIVLLGTTLGIALPLLVYIWKEERQYIFKELGKSDILQINATIMVGILILLTLGTFKHLTGPTIGLITASVIFPFAVSSMMVIISKEGSTIISKKVSTDNNGDKMFAASIIVMIVGFVYVIAAVITYITYIA